MERLAVEFKFSGGAEAGLVQGYGAVFGNVDDGGDMIQPGAFAKSLEAMRVAGIRLPMLVMHGLTSLGFTAVGEWSSVREDSKGLAVEGRVTGPDPVTRGRVLRMLGDGTFTGLSIGYRTVRYRPGGGMYGLAKRYLEELDVREVSLVTTPMNRLARISNIHTFRADAAAENVTRALNDLRGRLSDALASSR